MYIADRDSNRIRKVTVTTSVISTVAGSSTSSGYSGDNGAATSALLNQPWGVGIDSSGRQKYFMKMFLSLHFVDYI